MLGARIAALRRSRGMSQAQLADQLGISPSAIGMYEQNRREPAVEIIVALAKIFRVSTDYLLTGDPTPQEAAGLNALLQQRLDAADRRLAGRKERPFSRRFRPRPTISPRRTMTQPTGTSPSAADSAASFSASSIKYRSSIASTPFL